LSLGWGKGPHLTRGLGRRLRRYGVGTVLLLPTLCRATDVRVVGLTPGRSAAVVVERGEQRSHPVTLAIGETVDGVKLLEVYRDSAVLSIDGVTRTLPLVADRPVVGNTAGNGSVTLLADAHGQFYTTGTVNGRPVHFLVDTGATSVTLSRSDAQRIGLHYRSGMPLRSTTANGVVKGWQVSLDSVRVGTITVRNVDAFVQDNDKLSLGLLGMSFLRRCDMHRQGSTLVLRQHR
jgi:aspartyl protease family protein